MVLTMGSTLLAPMLGSARLAQSDEVVWADTVQGMREGTIVNSRYLEPDVLKSLYVREMQREHVWYVLIVNVFAAEEDEDRVTYGKALEDFSFDKWRSSLPSEDIRRRLHMSRLTAIGSDAVIEMVSNGHQQRVVVGTGDPTVFTVAGQECRLLNIRVKHLPIPITNQSSCDVFVRSEHEPSIKLAKQVALHLERKLRVVSLDALIRSDDWFIENSFFPLWYPFSSDQPPTYAEYRSRREMFCSGRGTKVDCW